MGSLLFFWCPNSRWHVADLSKIRKIWQDDELEAILIAYFEMLRAVLEGRTLRKSEPGAALRAKIGWTDGSIAFIHQNISAVLDELGMPWIVGYLPRWNDPNAFPGAIDRYLPRCPELLTFVPASRREGRAWDLWSPLRSCTSMRTGLRWGYGVCAYWGGPADGRLYRVHEFSKRPLIFELAPPLDRSVVCRPETWKVSFA